MIFALFQCIKQDLKKAWWYITTAWFCKAYWIDSHGVGECGDRRGRFCTCSYDNCPKRKENN